MAKSKKTSILVIFFDDIEDSMLLRQKYGADQFEKLIKAHNDLLHDIITRNNEGKIIKAIGDSILAVFKKPSIAVLRSIEVQKSISSHPLLKDIKVRIGMDMGEVTQYTSPNIMSDYMGPAVDYASRVKSMADGGHILITESLYRDSHDRIRNKTIKWKDCGLYKKKETDNLLHLYEVFDEDVVTPMIWPSGIREPSSLSGSMKHKASKMDEYLIGDIDAWTENIEFLGKSFILVDQFSELAEKNKVFLCGRRGSGKSAIAIMLGRKGNTGYDHCLTGCTNNIVNLF